MKRIKTFGGMLCAAVFVMGGLLATSCNKTEKENPGKENTGEPTPEVKEPVTFTVNAEASYTSATITGTVSEIVEGAEYGVVYGTAEKPEVGETTSSKTVEIAEDKTFTLDLTDLTEGTTSHYRAYICEKGAYTYSEDATFVTKAFPVAEIASTEILNSQIKVTFKSGLTLSKEYEIGVEYSTSEDFSGAKTRVLTGTDYDEEANLYIVRDIDLLIFSTTYCRPYVKDLQASVVKYYEAGEPCKSTVQMATSYFEKDDFKGFETTFPGSDGTFTPANYIAKGYSFGTLVCTASEFNLNTEGVVNYKMEAGADKNADFMDVLTGAAKIYCYTESLTDLTSGTYYRGYVTFGENGENVIYTAVKQLSL